MSNILVFTARNLHKPDIQNQLWTIIAAGSFSIFPSLVILLATRYLSLEMAGILAYNIALADLPRIFAVFGVRPYQSTDIRQEFGFNVYFGMRTICTASAAAVAFVIFMLMGFDFVQLATILLICLIYFTDAYADVFLGDLQQKGKMRIAGKMQSSAFFSAVLIFAIGVIFFQQLVLSLVFAGAAVILIYILWIWGYRSHFGPIRKKVNLQLIKSLALKALPLVISGFISMYLINAQKYYLDAFFTSELVAIYAILMLPVSLLMLACTSFFGGAVITKSAEILASGETKRFVRRINLQLIFALGLFLPFIASVFFLGAPLLSWVSSTDITPYKQYLMILSFGGLARLPLCILSPLLIILRKQKLILYCNIITGIAAAPVMWFLVYRYGLLGAAFSNLVLFTPQTLIYFVIYQKEKIRSFNYDK